MKQVPVGQFGIEAWSKRRRRAVQTTADSNRPDNRQPWRRLPKRLWPTRSLVKNPADMQQWYQFCAEMRDAAGAVNPAIHAGDQPAATDAMTRLAKSCEICHAVFRKDENYRSSFDDS